MKETVIVLDFGGQYNQLIARRVRECNVYCEILPYTVDIEKIKEDRAAAGDKIIFYDIPLLFEKNLQDDYDAVWVITSDRALRKERLAERDDMDENMAELIMDTQEDEDKKIEAADFVIYNNGSLAELERSVDDALVHFL